MAYKAALNLVLNDRKIYAITSFLLKKASHHFFSHFNSGMVAGARWASLSILADLPGFQSLEITPKWYRNK